MGQPPHGGGPHALVIDNWASSSAILAFNGPTNSSTSSSEYRGVMYFGQHDALHARFHAGIGELCRKICMQSGILDSGMAQDFQSGPIRVIHQKQGHSIVHGQVARAQELTVPLIVRKDQG